MSNFVGQVAHEDVLDALLRSYEIKLLLCFT